MLHRACLNALDRLGRSREQLAACFAKSADHGEADLTFSPRPELYPSVTASKPSTTTSSQSCAVPLCKRQFTMLLGAFCLYSRSKLIPSFYPIRLASESTPPIPAWRSCFSNFDFGTDRQYGRIVRDCDSFSNLVCFDQSMYTCHPYSCPNHRLARAVPISVG